MEMRPVTASPRLTDRLGRRISYLRLSVTDRCDLRCRYCMAEDMRFLPNGDLLTIDELATLSEAFIRRGVRKIRLTGGEPLVRRGIDDLARAIGRHIGHGLDELTITTNGTLLDSHAEALAAAGVRRINVSLDSRDPERFRTITRRGDLADVLRGLDAAKAAGLAIKINMVALKGVNEDEIEPMLRWCAEQGFDMTLIETMPLGEVDEDRVDRFLPLDHVRTDLESRYTLAPLAHRTGGPARYSQVEELGVRIGFITPMTANFCDGCNRVRVTAAGEIFPCLGHEDAIDLRAALRSGQAEAIDAALDEAMAIKPERHHFRIAERSAAPTVRRHMSVTGG
ncbi:GTP 3',8-cyclase MoaA [Sphingomonas crocodyli]|nr:GTP 3',8-cyclase MoaA [Sphingomonas crocodyli]